MGRYTPPLPNAYNFWVVLCSGMGSTAAAYALAVLGSTIGQPSFYASLNLAAQGEPGYGHTAQILSTINGLSSAGAAFGALFSIWSANRLSRKYTIQIGAAILVVGAAISAGSVDVAMFIVARFISGLGIGALFAVIPTYHSEVATPEARGFCVSLYGVLGATGYTFSAWIGYGTYYLSASGSTSTFPWRFPVAFQAIPALLVLAGSIWLPFSPRWLIQQGRFDDAEKILIRLHAKKGEEDQDQAQKEFVQMRKQFNLDQELSKDVRPLDIFRTAPNRKRLLLALIVMWGTVFTGPLEVGNYGVILFIQLGLSGSTPLLLLGIWTTLAIPGNFLAALYLDRFGRRRFLLIGATGLLLNLILECALQARYTGQGVTNKAGQITAVFFFYVYILIYTVFLDTTEWVYLNEIFPTQLRSQGAGFGLFNYFCAVVVLLVAGPIALNNIGWKFYFVFIISTTFYVLAIYFLFPETRQRSLEDINAAFGETVAVRYFDATEDDEKEYKRAIELETFEEVPKLS